jgi:5-methylthioadenosine/S-adenosylhomocysteine deaminase
MQTILEPHWIIPIEPAAVVLTDQAVVLEGSAIAAVLPVAEARRRYPAATRVSLPSHVLLPGLVNLHTHAAMVLMRGLADDLPLHEWLNGHIWPAEARNMSEAFVHDGTRVAAAEMLRGGITCFNDMYYYPEAEARAVGAAGIRAVIGLVVLEFATPYARDSASYLARARETAAALRGDSLVRCAVAPHAPYTVGDEGFRTAVALAEECDLTLHVHVHETETEIRDSVSQHGVRPLERLDRLGAVSRRTVAAHGVHLSEEEIHLLADRGAHVAHCPTANLKLASGMAPVARLLAARVNVGIGTDGAASNNRLDLWSELRLAALLAKAVAGRADALPAHEALAMATLRGARALGLDSEVGSLRPGKRADIVAVDLGAPELAPCFDPASHLTYAAGREHVTHVWVDGRPVVADRALLTLDLGEMRALASEWGRRLAST